MEDSIAIRIQDVTKLYRIWSSPSARLWHLLWNGSRSEGSSDSQRPGRRGVPAYREFHALRNVSFNVAHGECMGVLGYNGAGKSTLLQIIAGTVKPTSGSVEVRGRVAALLELGSGFNPEFTGRENALLYGAILGLDPAEMKRRLPEIEAFAEIGEYIDQPVRTYSSGMVVRLAFSVLTQIDPDILIIDEALSVGDAYFQAKSMGLMRRFREQGKCLLLVTHAIEIIKSMCDRAVILEHGMLVKEGPAEAVADYYNAMVASRERDLQIRQTEGTGGRVRTRSGNRRVLVVGIELLGADNVPRRVFTPRERLRLSCVVEFCQDMQMPTVGFLIRDRLGNDVFGTNTYHLGLREGSFAARERVEFVFDVELSLGPGQFSVTVAAHAGERHTVENYDWVDNLIGFEVVPGKGSPSVGTLYLDTNVSFSRGLSQRYRVLRPGEIVQFGLDGEGGRYRGSGWSHPEEDFTWTDGEEALLLIQLQEPPVREVMLEIIGSAFTTSSLPRQRVIFVTGDREISTWIVGDQEDVFTLHVPPALIDPDGALHLKLRLPDAVSPASAGLHADQRRLGVRIRSMRLA